MPALKPPVEEGSRGTITMVDCPPFEVTVELVYRLDGYWRIVYRMDGGHRFTATGPAVEGGT